MILDLWCLTLTSDFRCAYRISYTISETHIGVRQGSCEGPVLFLFIMQAAMETLEWPEGVSKPEIGRAHV